MILTCSRCDTRFRVDASRLKPTGSKVRCSRCAHVFVATPPPTSPELAEDLDLMSPDVEASNTETRRVDAAALVAFALESSQPGYSDEFDPPVPISSLAVPTSSASFLDPPPEGSNPASGFEGLGALDGAEAFESAHGIEDALRAPSIDLPEADAAALGFLDQDYGEPSSSIDIAFASGDSIEDFLAPKSSLGGSLGDKPTSGPSFLDVPESDPFRVHDSDVPVPVPVPSSSNAYVPESGGFLDTGPSSSSDGTGGEPSFLDQSLPSLGRVAVGRLQAKKKGAPPAWRLPSISPRIVGLGLGLGLILGGLYSPSVLGVFDHWLRSQLHPSSLPRIPGALTVLRTESAYARTYPHRAGQAVIVRGTARNHGKNAVEAKVTVMALDGPDELFRASARLKPSTDPRLVEPGGKAAFTVVLTESIAEPERLRFRIEYEPAGPGSP